MPPKKAKLANPAKTASKDGAPTNSEGLSGSISGQLAQDAIPTIEAFPSSIPPADIPPPVTKPHKNLTVDIDPIPAIIPQRNGLSQNTYFPPVSDDEVSPHNVPHFSDEKPPVDEKELRHHDIVVKKYPYRHERIDHHLDETRRVHQADFAVPQEVLNVTKSDESITFEEAALPTEKFHAERASVTPNSPTEQHEFVVNKNDERTQELLENTSRSSVYPTDANSESGLDNSLLTDVDDEKVDSDVSEVLGAINDRKDVKVFFEKFVFNSDTYPASYPLIQTNIAKRKKRFTLAELPPWQMVPPELTETVPTSANHPKSHHGKTGSSPAALPSVDAKNQKKGKSPILVIEPDRDSTVDKELHEKPVKEDKKGGKKQGPSVSGADGAPSPMLKTGELTPIKNGIKGPDRPQTGGSRFDLKAAPSTMNSPSVIAEPVKVSENLQPPVVERVKEQSSWEAFFGESEKLIDEAFDPNEIGTGYDTVPGPTGLRKQFLEDERTSGFFKKLLDELVTDWLHPASSLDASAQHEDRRDERWHPSLQEALSVVRKKKKDTGDWSQHAFHGAADAYMERLEGLQKVVYPQYDRGPQQCTIPIANLPYDKFDGVSAVLRREFTYSQAEPFMKSYDSQLYPKQDPGRKTFTVNREVLRYYAPMTSAKDIEYDPRNMPSGGSYLPDHYLTPSQVKTCNPVITDMMAKNEADLTKQMKFRSVRRQEPTPRPQPIHSTLQFPKPKKPPLPRSYYNAKESPHSLFVVRRLNADYWPERMLPSIRPDAVRPRYLQSTKTWSIYVATQRKLVRQVQELARRREETRRQFYLERSCYCRQGRPNYQPKFTPKRKNVTKKQVKLRWSKLALNQSFTGVYCPRLQPPVLTPPKYQHFGGNLDIPEAVTEHGYKNPLWNALREEKAAAEQNLRKLAEEKEVNAKNEKVADVSQNVAVTTQQVSTAFLVQPPAAVGAPHGKQSAKPRHLVASSARENKHEAGKKNNLLPETNVQIVEPSNHDESAPPIPTVMNQEEDGISLVIPDKTTAVRKPAPDRLEKVSPTIPKSSPRDQSPERGQMLNTDTKPVSHLLPTNSLLLPGTTPELLSANDHLTKYTFADVPPDVRYSLLKMPGGIDQLVGYTRQETVKPLANEQPKEPSRPTQPALLEAVSSSILSVLNKDAIPSSNSWDTQERRDVVERIAEQEEKVAEARAARAYVSPLLPRYMMGKKYRESKEKVRTPRPASEKMEGDPQREVRSRERNREHGGEAAPISPLNLMFEQAARRNTLGQGDVVAGKEITRNSSNHCVSRNEKADVRTNFDYSKTFEGRPLPESIKGGMAHPRQQRSLIYFDRPKTSNKQSNRRKSKKKPSNRYETTGDRERFAEPGGFLAAGDRLRSSPDDLEIAQTSPKLVREMGPMEKSTVKTVPRRAAERKITRKKFGSNFRTCSEGKLGKKSSWLKMDPNLNVKSYAVMRHNANKYKHPKQEQRKPKNLFVLHDNFWKQKTPFVVALSSKPSRKMLPHLRQYLLGKQKETTNLSEFQKILTDYKVVDSLSGPVVFTLKTQADAEMEFQKIDKTEKIPDFVSKVLRYQKLKRLKSFLPDAEKLPLKFSDLELASENSRPAPLRWSDYLSLSNASFIKQSRPQAALYTHLEQRQAQLHAERLVRRYTGEYHHTHLLRSILKSRLQSSAPDVKAPNLDAQTDVPPSSEVSEDHPEEEPLIRVTAQSSKGKSPNATKSGKAKNALDVESESVLSDDGDVTATKSKRVDMKRESGQNIRGAGPVSKDKAKARGASATPSHKPINEHPKVTAALADGKTTEPGDQHPKTKPANQGSPSADSQNDKHGSGEWPPWWRFDVSEVFSDQTLPSDQQQNRKAELFGSQMSLLKTQLSPAADQLDSKQDSRLTFQEKSLLDLVRLLKEKFDRTKPKDDRVPSDDTKAKEPYEETVHPNSNLVSTFPDEIQRVIKRFQDIAAGRLPDQDNAEPQDTVSHKDDQDTKGSLEHKFSIVGTEEELGSRGILGGMEYLTTDEEELRVSCEVRIDPEDYSWQLPQINEIRKKVALRCKYYDACIDYLKSLIPLGKDEVLSTKLEQLNLSGDNLTASPASDLPRIVQMRNLAVKIDEHAFTNCSSDFETIENRIAGLVLQLQLAKLHVAHLADEAIDKAQRRYNHDLASKWYAKIKGYKNFSPSMSHALHLAPLSRTPPSSPPRCLSPSKLAQDTGADMANEEDGKDKKGKGDKTADKSKKGKEVKANKSDDKKPRVGSDNAKGAAKKNSASSKHGPSK